MLTALRRLLSALSCVEAYHRDKKFKPASRRGQSMATIMLYVPYLTLRSCKQLRTGELSSGTAGKGDNYLKTAKKKPQTQNSSLARGMKIRTLGCAWLLLISFTWVILYFSISLCRLCGYLCVLFCRWAPVFPGLHSSHCNRRSSAPSSAGQLFPITSRRPQTLNSAFFYV